ncbi:TRAP transporter large permease [Desulfopila inferna]|uniref:TRAP transporter large permease n=1 Tax=Desulfopila inferna TaxID=468528 RepID=UPI001962E98E|nr:TRAP transporter large permease [Desulfopila inferna]MBM9606197.1 TRAP transporter large permease [Desulfopila inferna]
MEYGILLGIILFFVLIFIGLPLWLVFLGTTTAIIFMIDGSLNYMAGTFYHAVNNYLLMAIAFFIYAGNLISVSGIATRLVRLSYALVGRIKGGLVDVAIVAAAFMGALTGSSIPVLAALVPILVPGLEKLGYQRKYVTAVLCSSSFLGYLIPPSVPALIYCLVAQQSVAAVFLATVIPALLLVAGYILLNTLICHRYYKPSENTQELPSNFSESVKEISASTWAALPALGCPIVVLVGIYGGIFTPNEAGAVAVVYTTAVGFFMYREMTLKNFWSSTIGTIVTMGMFAFLLGFGTVFTRLLIMEEMGEVMTQFILSISDNYYIILLMLNLLILILGMFLDGIPVLIIAVPLIMPLMDQMGMNLVHLGAMMVMNIGLGVVSPPYALSIFVGTRISGVAWEDLVPPMLLFFFLVGIPVLLLVTYVPWISLWLPTLVLGPQVVGIR